jgi:Terminase large subunit, T4likevirus-type, N-terminal
MVLNASRQSGKSTIVALLNLHTAMYVPNSLCLMLSPTLRQSGELFRKAKDLIGHVETCRLPEESTLSLRLANGSRIVSLPGREGSVRGYSDVRLLSIDEASRVPDELYMACRPMLAVSGGRLVAMSTPFGTRGWWYVAWRSNEGWERYEVPAEECPRISAEFLAEERRTIGEWWYRQEYGCEFLDAQSAAFTREDVNRAFRQQVETWAL